ncbi:uncharacterized protein LOC128230217 isoform X3 [Mya arenaria]|uniref:uncharacterized protein LOC128230217 isoform X3 n=1 Tax=Mya arenaria TaxID=6604 RepID=UPI0022E36C68|nr:uncharacterized protein LOC128230217 isoform X3 [Mya arenaria]
MNRGRKFGDVKRMTVNGGSGVEEDTTFSNLAQFNGPETALDIDPGAENTCTNFANTEIYRQLRPLLICMRLFGLFFRRTIDTKGRPYMEPVVMYCFIVNFLNVLNAIRSFTVYSSSDEFDSVMVQKLLFTIWSSECTFKGLLLMWNCYKQDGLPKFFLEWDAVCGNVKLSKAHSPLEHIYTIRFSRSSNDTQLQMFMFLNRLTGTQVGLSAMKLFVVDKPTILTIAGMMITYFVLLIEFKMPADTNCACHVNGTIVMDNSTLLISHVSYT